MANLYGAAADLRTLEQLAQGSTAAHRLHPMAKLLVTICYLVAVISFPPGQVSGLIPFLFYPVLLMILSETPFGMLLGRTAAALPFSLLAGLSNVFLDRRPALFVGGFSITFGAVSCFSLLLKTLLTVAAVLLLISTTPFPELSGQLTRLKVPAPLCLQMLMTYRYLSVLLEEVRTMVTAYLVRSPGRKGVRLRDMGVFVGQLLLRSFDRAERVYCAMKCRGFSGACPATVRAKARARDYAYAASVCAALLFLRFFNLSVFLGNLF